MDVSYASISILNLIQAATGSQCREINGAFPLRGTTWFGTARYGTARFGSVCLPHQFSTALEWARLFTCSYTCAASTAVTSS